ncbi:glycosyl hydrolase, partial [Arthrobacter sp. HMWF013]
VEGTIYTYNQGPVLGALLELGGEANLARAADVIGAVARHLTVPAPVPGAAPDAASPAAPARVLRCDGTGDGGLFTGILCRYLALAALDDRLPASARSTAAELVLATAEAFWAGRRPEHATPGQGNVIFSIHATQPAGATYPPGAAVELSTQLQAWMVLEAAATLPPQGAG